MRLQLKLQTLVFSNRTALRIYIYNNSGNIGYNLESGRGPPDDKKKTKMDKVKTMDYGCQIIPKVHSLWENHFNLRV